MLRGLKIFKGIGRYLKFGGIMAIAYAKLLKDELATKKDIAILEEKMNAMEERILRYVDNRFNQLDKKMTIGFVILILLYVITNPNAIELIKLLFGVK